MQLSDSITRFHYAAVLAHKLDNDTLAWMEASVHIPETVYKEGSGSVSEASYLEGNVIVESAHGVCCAKA